MALKSVTITKGVNKGLLAYITNSQKEEIGNDRIFCLQDENGVQLWNGQSCWFPESFIKTTPARRVGRKTDVMLKLGDYVVDQESKDYSRSTNGGEYEFGHYPVLKDGKEVGQLLDTSAGFDYCQIRGSFTSTNRVDVKDTEIVFFADKQMHLDEEITEGEFLSLIS